mmetsp:Transcript_63610/g.201044  ORF Transcript_63610/g.201044 Transcript_63610/m.201044 type:complete len:187 (-) Transcript_63610:491-1051(-)
MSSSRFASHELLSFAKGVGVLYRRCRRCLPDTIQCHAYELLRELQVFMVPSASRPVADSLHVARQDVRRVIDILQTMASRPGLGSAPGSGMDSAPSATMAPSVGPRSAFETQTVAVRSMVPRGSRIPSTVSAARPSASRPLTAALGSGTQVPATPLPTPRLPAPVSPPAVPRARRLRFDSEVDVRE